jgi:hypothetical protein
MNGMAFLFIKVYTLLAFIKTIFLGLLLWHDAYDDPWVWYMAFQTVSSVGLVYYRDTHLHSKRKDILNIITPIVYMMRTLSIYAIGLTRLYYHERSATFAFIFLILLVLELGISWAAAISRQSYKRTPNKDDEVKRGESTDIRW